MQLLIVTGMSGAGKSCVMDVMEDIGYYCIDNIPSNLIMRFVELCRDSGNYEKVAIAVDIRSGDNFDEIFNIYKLLRESDSIDVKVLFTEASEEVLIKRYKETRRKHPLDARFHGNLHKAIRHESVMLVPMREIADFYIETSLLKVNELKERVTSYFLDSPSDSMDVRLMSFGFKYGVSTECDLVFDVRCLPNPFYQEELKGLTGLDERVRNYVMGFEQSQTLFNKLCDLIDFLMPLYIHEGKSRLVIAFGCTGGKHRSVTFAELLTKHLESQNIRVQTYHRDKEK